jgi:serine phosphatase RsbU (regulator of sigma subunit)
MALGMHDHFEPEVFEVQIQKGDWVLFHSDGMTPHLLEQIHALISGVPSVSSTEADQELTKRVNAAVVEASVSDHLAISLVRFS